MLVSLGRQVVRQSCTSWLRLVCVTVMWAQAVHSLTLAQSPMVSTSAGGRGIKVIYFESNLF